MANKKSALKKFECAYFFGCPTRIRTMTDRIKICSATVTPWDIFALLIVTVNDAKHGAD